MGSTARSFYLPVGIASVGVLAVLVLPGHSESPSKVNADTKRKVVELVKKLTDKDAKVRDSAAFVLGYIGPASETVPALVTALKDQDASVRHSAAAALGKIGPAAKDAVPALAAALEHEYKSMRHAAEEALKKIQAEE